MLTTINVNKIAKKLKYSFESHNRPASRFTNKQLWNDCQSLFSDRSQVDKTIFANDLGVPPLKAVIRILIDDYNYSPDIKFSAEEARNLGALVNFVFKEILCYDTVSNRRTVRLCGINEGCIFSKSNMKITKDAVVPDEPSKEDFGDW